MSINKKYIGMLGLFWMIFCIAGSFLSLYLQDKGMDSTGIGLVTAVSGAISAALQPALGKLYDRSSRLTWKKVLLVLIVVFLLVCALMLVIPGKLTGALLLGLLFLDANLMMPLVNSAMSYYQQKKEHINFGAARGAGSALYALAALVIGNLAAGFGSAVVPAAGLLAGVGFFFVVRQMPCEASPVQRPDSKAAAEKGFAKRYPAFMLMTAAFVLQLASHNMVGIYLLQIMQTLGGGSQQLGIAMAIQALLELPVLFGFSRLLKKFRAGTLMQFAAMGFVVKAAAYAQAGNILSVYLVQATQMVSFAIFASASVYYVLETVEPRDQVTGQALMTGTIAAGNVLGSLIGGELIDSFGISCMLHVNIVIAAAGFALAILPGRMLKRQKNKGKAYPVFHRKMNSYI